MVNEGMNLGTREDPAEVTTIPTVGFNVETVEYLASREKDSRFLFPQRWLVSVACPFACSCNARYRNIKFTVWDIGGGQSEYS